MAITSTCKNFRTSIAEDIHKQSNPWSMGWCNFSAFLLWRWNEAKQKKSCKAWYCFHFTSMVLTAEAASFKGNFFFIWSTTLMLLYTSWKGAGHSDTSWEKWTFFPPDSHGTLVLLFFLFPRDEPKTWKLPWVMRYSASVILATRLIHNGGKYAWQTCLAIGAVYQFPISTGIVEVVSRPGLQYVSRYKPT